LPRKEPEEGVASSYANWRVTQRKWEKIPFNESIWGWLVIY